MRRAGLRECGDLVVRWPAEVSGRLHGDKERMSPFLKKAFLALEDRDVVRLLLEGAQIEVVSETNRAWLDLSRKGRCLNLSLERPRRRNEVAPYLDRMPELRRMSLEKRDSLSGTRVFLVHHITSEILATIAALENMGAPALCVLFVKYAGMVPSDYLEALHALPEDSRKFYGLHRVEDARSIDGHYLLSGLYSSIRNEGALEHALSVRRADFFEAMRLSAGFLFFKEAFLARKAGERMLLIEDGGYLAPLLNRFCLEGRTLGQTLEHFALGPEEPGCPSVSELDGPLGDWLADFFPGSVEHTRNGYDRLNDVRSEFGRLRFPALSIAVSGLKRDMESEEVAVSLIGAAESVLHGSGLVISRRRALVLGCAGAIGRRLMSQLSFRISEEAVHGVDPADSPFPDRTARNLYELPLEILYDTDLIVGVVGKSILTRAFLEDLILNSRRRAIFFVSGSTKTAEFTDLSRFLGNLRESPDPKIGRVPVRTEVSQLRDPQTGLVQGTRVRIHFEGFDVDFHPCIPDHYAEYGDLSGDKPEESYRDLYLLGDLTPLNFLYYGVPTEIMDPILTQLLQVAAGLVADFRGPRKLSADLLAVDHEIDEDGRLI